MLSPPWSKSG